MEHKSIIFVYQVGHDNHILFMLMGSAGHAYYCIYSVYKNNGPFRLSLVGTHVSFVVLFWRAILSEKKKEIFFF